MPDARQLVVNLLLLHLQLSLVRQVLPFASAADAKVLATGCRAYITIFMETHHLAFGEAVFFPLDLHVHHIARHAERHENYEFVPMEQ